MIIVKLQGGLGNQLFQYATGRALAEWHGSSLAFDLRAFRNNANNGGITPRAFELGAFGIKPVQPTLLDELALGTRSIPYKGRVQKMVRKWRNITEYREQDTVYDPFLTEKTSANTYLVGYFQSEHYFKNIENSLRQELSFTNGGGVSVDDLPSDCDLVSLHVRRGDYVSNLHTNRVHGLCSLEYYQKSAAYVANRTEKVHFIVFSDDQPWVKRYLELSYPVTFLEGNQGQDSYKDMRLMSLCQHHIVANSSFSWWGAWLNPSPNKIVVAPDRWLARERDASESADRIPAGWVRM